MALDPQTLLQLSRGELATMARQAGVAGAETLTRTELADELLRHATPDGPSRRRLRGWFGTARDMLASLVERGLNLPDAAALIRGDAPSGDFRWQPPLATITLAKIYDAQGYRQRALDVLEDLLRREPEHAMALRIKNEWAPVSEDVDDSVAVTLASDASDAPASDAPASDAPRPAPSPALKYKNETATFTPVGSTGAHFAWDLDEKRFAVSDCAPPGRLTLTVAAFCTFSDGTRVTQRDIELHGAWGETDIDSLPSGAVLRSFVSWQLAGRSEILLVPARGEERALARAELTAASDPIKITKPAAPSERNARNKPDKPDKPDEPEAPATPEAHVVAP